MDFIKVKDIVLYGNHGVFQEEKTLGQQFILHLTLFHSIQETGLTGNLEKSVHYGDLTQKVTKIFKEESLDLIEECVEKIAQFILDEYEIVEEVTVELEKPWAPIGQIGCPIVSCHRKRNKAFIGVGSNIGDSKENISLALEKLESSTVKILKKSSIIKTKAWGVGDQPDFLNGVVEIETTLEAKTLLRFLQEIENELGRIRDMKWGPRLIDLDLLFFNDETIYTKDLVVPHPYIEERDFVLEPMKEIAPFFIHPVSKKQMRQIEI